MRVAKEQVDGKLDIPGAVLRQRTEFGDAPGFGNISGEYFTLAAGVDSTPLFQGLEGNACRVPIGASSCVVGSPPPIPPASRKPSVKTISFIGLRGTT
jgi:hypothetical protein